MEVGSVSSGGSAAAATARPSAAGGGQSLAPEAPQTGAQTAEAEKKDSPTESKGLGNSDYQNDFYAPKNMSSQDSMKLRNDAESGMLETIKDIAALQILEKMVEALGKIMED
jgi:hypothetical protein